MTEHDVRHSRLMRDLLQQYLAGKAPLETLIAGLEALLNALVSVDQEWTSAFHSQWGVLEIEYAVALDRQQPTLGSQSLDRISHAVENLRRLVEDRIGEEPLEA
jgi:hypothetical protein